MTQRSEFDQPECNFLVIRQAARHVTQYYDKCLAPTGLRSTQFTILAHLRRLGPMTINGLSAALVMDRTTLGRTMLPLERDGLIAIAPGTKDRRSKELRLTAEGERRLAEARLLWSAAQDCFESHFGPERSTQLRRELRVVIASEFQ